jgi:hypothetical protein
MIIILQLWRNTWLCNTGCVVVIIQQGNTETERTKLEKRKSWCSTMAVSPSSGGMKKSMWQWSLLNTLLSPDGNDKAEQKLKFMCVCVIINNTWVAVTDQLLQKWKVWVKWYVKLFRRVLNATILFPWIIYRNKIGWMSRIKIGWEADYLKFRTDFIRGVIAKILGVYC